MAALWTAPVAWGRVPIVGNVKLEILSERMVKGPSVLGRSAATTSSENGGDERLIVRWRTIGKSRAKDVTAAGSSFFSSTADGQAQPQQQQQQQQPTDKFMRFLSLSSRGTKQTANNEKDNQSADEEEFTGLFIFTFDDEGRILTHTIEHVEEDGSDLNNNWDKMKVVSVTDWLLGTMKKKRKGAADEGEGGLAWGYCRTDDDNDSHFILGRRGLEKKEAEERRRM